MSKAQEAENFWTQNKIATRDEVRMRLVEMMLCARDIHGDKVVDEAIRLAMWDYTAMRSRERMEVLRCSKPNA